MKKIAALTLFSLIVAAGALTCVFAKNINSQMLPVFSAQAKQSDRLWVGTFQLVWNEFSNNIVKGPILFKDGTPEVAKQLNKQEFTKAALSDSSYYTVYGRTTLKLKKEIETAIMKKFGEKSELLDKIDWKNPNNAYLIYAMLYKNFKFTTRFDILKQEKFAKNSQSIPYFGIDKESRNALYNGVDVLFYNNPFDYSVALKSDKDKVILYRTNSNKNFNVIYNDLQNKSAKYKGNKKFAAGDQLKVPFMSIKQDTDYKELCNKEILNTDRLYIAQALQTVDFNMDNSGVKLKSEAVMNIMFMSMPIKVKEKGRNFFFNDTFVLFMQENDKTQPYFAVRVNDMNLYKFKGEVK